MKKENKEEKKVKILIEPPKLDVATFKIRGITKLVIHKFSQKAFLQMKAKQEAGKQSDKEGKKNREPKDFEALYEGAKYKMQDGSCGFPANAIRNAMINACRLCNFKMTYAKMGIVTVLPDGDDDGYPLVKITKGQPHKTEMPARNDNGGIDIRVRPMWDEGWEATVRIRYDSDMFQVADIANLLARAGYQVGLCEGRPFSKDSNGMGWGLFEVINE